MCIFLDDRDYRQLVHLLGETVEEFSIRCWNYCVMPNHYHATLEPTQPNLSDAIRRLNGVYAQWWNRRHSRVGHVFQGRFKAQIVDREEYLLALSRYVVMNPVRAGLVKRPEEWEWSSYCATVGLSHAPAFLAKSDTLDLFGNGHEAFGSERFASFVGVPSDDSTWTDRIRSDDQILGSAAFKQQVRTPAGRTLRAGQSETETNEGAATSDPGLTPV